VADGAEALLRLSVVLVFNSCRRVDAMAAQVIQHLLSKIRKILREDQLHVFNKFYF
jgi:hypothetical protein